jgi:GT2 family glycosyltransferase
MSEPQVTIVVVPRERFSITRRALEALYANTSEPFRLVYVDGGSPASVRRYLAAQARERGFQLMRSDRHLTPNEARNLGLRHVTTPYVVFIDNDAVPAPGWLGALVRCAEETGAWVVGPLYYIGEPHSAIIHMAGGDAHFEESAGRRRFVERHRFANQPAARVRERLSREAFEQVEFHCMLVRANVFDKLGPLDEGLMSVAEHTDLCLLVRKHGGRVYFEPEAVVTYVVTGGVRLFDLRYFLRRWSEAWTAASVEGFCVKWGVDASDAGMVALQQYARGHRHILLAPAQRALTRVLGWRRSRWLCEKALPWFEVRLNRRWVQIESRRGRTASVAGEPSARIAP